MNKEKLAKELHSVLSVNQKMDDMFTSFANLYVGRPREAEHSDARLDIRQHDPDQERSKKERKDKDPDSLFNEDDIATVSVEALRVFLKNFLGSLEADGTRGTAMPVANDHTESPPTPQVQGRAARAASAYAHASETGAAGKYGDINAPAPPSAASLQLPSEDVRVIHKLLDDLKILSDRKIENLRIERGSSFLQTLVLATEKALAL